MHERSDDRATVAAEIQHLARGKHMHATILHERLLYAPFKTEMLERQAAYEAIDAQREAAKMARWARVTLGII